jgi:hypothetical protein
MMSAFSLLARRSAVASGLFLCAGAWPASVLAASDCRIAEGLPEAYRELAQTELHATPPVHPPPEYRSAQA